MSETLEQVRSLIRKSRKTRYAIWKETGISQAQLWQLMAGQKGLSIIALERLLDGLGYTIKFTRKRKS